MFNISNEMASLIEALIPLMAGVYIFLFYYGVIPYPTKDPVKQNYLKNKLPLLRLCSITMILIGLAKIIYVLYAQTI